MNEIIQNAAKTMMQDTLHKVVEKLRAKSNQSEAEAMERFISDTKAEVRSQDINVKVVAVQKAMYFHMMGFSSDYANFPIIECMADPIFYNKNAGYLAACCTFSDDVDVLPLMTSLLTRDMRSSSQYEVGLALYAISSVCNTDLAKELVVDVVNLLHHPRPYVRKRAVLCLYKIFLQYPEALRPTYARLKDKLDDNSELSDTDASVRGAVVAVLCELARRNPANFLGLAVPFFHLLQSEQSNWTLIKIIKVFGYFAPLEPRLGKKLVEPLTKIIQTTSAKSVQYECVLAIANGMSKVPAVTKLAAEKIRTFIEDADQNIRYLGLDALSRMVREREHKKLLLDQRDVVKRCLDDPDPTIRRKALGILRYLVTRKNCAATIDFIFDKCLSDVSDERWANLVMATIVAMAQTGDYEYVEDFEWYFGVLLDMALLPLPTFACGALIERELVTILSRVNGMRAAGVAALAQALSDLDLRRINPAVSTQWRVLCAAAFGCGEYPHWVPDRPAVCRLLLREEMQRQPALLQTACLTAVAKIAAFTVAPCERHTNLRDGEELAPPLPPDADDSVGREKGEVGSGDDDAAQQRTSALERVMAAIAPDAAGGDVSAEKSGDGRVGAMPGLTGFCHSTIPEVQERACVIRALLRASSLSTLPQLFAEELLPVSAGSQAGVEPPPELELDRPFCADFSALMPLSDSDGDDEDGDRRGVGSDGNDDDNFDLEYRVQQHALAERSRREKLSAFYLTDGEGGGGGGGGGGSAGGSPLQESKTKRSNLKSAAAASDAAASVPRSQDGDETGASRRRHRLHRQPGKAAAYAINRNLAQPAHYDPARAAESQRAAAAAVVDEATRKFRDIDVTRALADDEKLPEPVPYGVSTRHLAQTKTTSATLSTAATRPSTFPPEVLVDRKPVRVELRVEPCKPNKMKKHSITVKFSITLSNLSSSSTLRSVSLAWRRDTLPASLTLQSAAKADDGDKAEDKADGDACATDGEVLLPVTEKLRPGAVVSVTLRAEMPCAPDDDFGAAVAMELHALKDKKPLDVPLAVPLLRFGYLAAPPREVPSPDMLLTLLRSEALAQGGGGRTAAFVPCGRKALMDAFAAMPGELLLEPVEVFKDAVTLYGCMRCPKKKKNKTEEDSSFVVVLLKEATRADCEGLLLSEPAGDDAANLPQDVHDPAEKGVIISALGRNNGACRGVVDDIKRLVQRRS